MDRTTTPHDFAEQSKSIKDFDSKQDYDFSQYDILPIPIEIFAPDGTSIYINRASMEMVNIQDASLVVGIYNYKNDPVCIEICGQNVIDRVFRGETVSFPDFPAPIQDVKDRGVVDEKPWEAATMDLTFTPKWDGNTFLYTICIFNVKNIYYGRADVVEAKKYIDEHWLDKFSDDAVANAVHISLRHLSALFRQNTGMTMGDYYKKVKVDHIKEKLKDKNLTVAQAFSFCGEDSRGAYARIFKEIIGMTPTEYRDSLK